ncbi:hypothetical protein D3C71_1281060 [compost metagenome]
MSPERSKTYAAPTPTWLLSEGSPETLASLGAPTIRTEPSLDSFKEAPNSSSMSAFAAVSVACIRHLLVPARENTCTSPVLAVAAAMTLPSPESATRFPKELPILDTGALK